MNRKDRHGLSRQSPSYARSWTNPTHTYHLRGSGGCIGNLPFPSVAEASCKCRIDLEKYSKEAKFSDTCPCSLSAQHRVIFWQDRDEPQGRFYSLCSWSLGPALSLIRGGEEVLINPRIWVMGHCHGHSSDKTPWPFFLEGYPTWTQSLAQHQTAPRSHKAVSTGDGRQQAHVLSWPDDLAGKGSWGREFHPSPSTL